MEKRYFTIREASEYLGFSTHTLYTWTSQRRIPFVKVGGRLRFDKRSLDAWLERFTSDAVDDEIPGRLRG